MLQGLKNLIVNKLAKGNKYVRNMYAISQGSFRGEFFIYINHDDKNYYFLSLPYNNVREVPVNDFNEGIKKGLVEFLEKIPKNVYEICVAQYNEAKAKNNINRLKQPTPPRSVDSGKRSRHR